MKRVSLEDNVEKLELDTKIINVFTRNNICLVEDIWHKKRKELKAIGLDDYQINQVIVKMQLNGLDLNKKIY